MKSIGIDVGTSFIKVSLLEVESGRCLGTSTCPESEMPVHAERPGWAEQDPDMWWKNVGLCLKNLDDRYSLKDVKSIGITYQMHGLVCVDKKGKPLRKSIIWSDSRAVEIGAKAFKKIGKEECLTRLLNSPGNFTASKMAWVKQNEPEVFSQTYKFFLPGDYIAYKLTGDMSTTDSGLSEQILWDFSEDAPARFVREHYGIPASYVPAHKSSLGVQSLTSAEVERTWNIPKGTPVSYRAGDQPNNAFSLNVMEEGEVAATAGTSGVVYGITSKSVADDLSRVNQFLHVNHHRDNPHYGVLLCINGTGILNAWIRRNLLSGMSYDQMNKEASKVPAGSEGLLILPFGNGAERMLENRYTGVQMSGLDLNRHHRGHFVRAAQEGIAFSFRYGIEIMKEMGMQPGVIRAGEANMFLSPVFIKTLASLTGATIELYNTDGALGAARGAAWGAGLYKSRRECFSGLEKVRTQKPEPSWEEPLEKAYITWKKQLESILSNV
ncbi:MAG: FGGY family carbohydrate kinase [Bacteroidales bacterium]|nr:FGGY family carbohydrate kinase [Bacteroidales bacterium]MDD3105219.1 FGGY family carbohydrate kinase [Bacteroidales bacterium]MDD3549957.1 FGGY family carbohydrate kinase [Bacteroidales bacterium]MDD4064973.1 FGGY family carbohydrate kinase [Bacteroidales bacterium]MDD4500159.1 FGGY family carbohydrate kinase [Bacteroidales bacterium]